jgi:hypothetical protein
MHITSPQYYSLSPITVRLFLQSPLISQFHSHYFHISIKLPPNPPYKKPFPVPVDFVTTVIPCGGNNIRALPLRCGRWTGIWVVNEYHTHTPRKCTPQRNTLTVTLTHTHTTLKRLVSPYFSFLDSFLCRGTYSLTSFDGEWVRFELTDLLEVCGFVVVRERLWCNSIGNLCQNQESWKGK